MFQILCDPSSGSTELCLTVVLHRYFVVCLVGVWQRNFGPVACVYDTAGWPAVPYTHAQYTG
jgi:hypothetical protein